MGIFRNLKIWFLIYFRFFFLLINEFTDFESILKYCMLKG